MCLCLFLAAVHPLWGFRREKEKGKQPILLFLPLQFTNVTEGTFYLDEKKKGGGEAPQEWNAGDSSAWQTAFPKRNKDGGNFQKTHPQSSHCNCQCLTFPPRLLVRKKEQAREPGRPHWALLSLPSPTAMQTFILSL